MSGNATNMDILCIYHLAVLNIFIYIVTLNERSMYAKLL